MSNPYSNRPDKAFWRTGVAEKSPFEISDLWAPRFAIDPRHKIATAGSCFAQHIGNALSAKGFDWVNAEAAPAFLSNDDQRLHNYGIFSFRTGNIYTARMLLQWLKLATGETVLGSDEIWETDERFFDPLRPAIEPNGFATFEEAVKSRQTTLRSILKAITDTNVFVFTMGLTECWQNKATGFEYASCSGTAAGRFDPDQHVFVNHAFGDILSDMAACLKLMRGVNPKLRVILTVSPVPLTATATDQHVLVATSHSKSILRAVAGEVQSQFDFVDYFPSYEVITSPTFRGMFFGPNARTVVSQGVDQVMNVFFAGQQTVLSPRQKRRMARLQKGASEPLVQDSAEDIVCEVEMLNAFAR